MVDYKWPDGAATAAKIKNDFGPRTMLAFSRGKDSIAAWLAIRSVFEEVIPIYRAMVPGLEFIEESLDYYERAFGVKIWRMIHPKFYKQLKTFLFQTPRQAAIIAAANLPDFTYEDVNYIVADAVSLSRDKVMVATGIRVIDSLNRRAGFAVHGPISVNRRSYMPVWDWSKDRLCSEIERSGIKLPRDYLMYPRSFDGLGPQYLVPMKKHFPRDYARVLEWFPLADLEVWRYERQAAR